MSAARKLAPVPERTWHCSCGNTATSAEAHHSHRGRGCTLRFVTKALPPPAPQLQQNPTQTLSPEILAVIREQVDHECSFGNPRAQNMEDYYHAAQLAVLEAVKDGYLPVPETAIAITRRGVNQAWRYNTKFWRRARTNVIPEEAIDPEWEEARYYQVRTRIEQFWTVRRGKREELLARGVPPVEASRRAQGYALQHLAQDIPPVFRAMTFLSSTERYAVYWYYWQNMEQREIANRLNVSQASVARLLENTRRRLARYLGAAYKRVPTAWVVGGGKN